MIAAVVHFLRLEQQYVRRTSHHAQLTALAMVDVHGDSSFDFCHIHLLFKVKRIIDNRGAGNRFS